ARWSECAPLPPPTSASSLAFFAASSASPVARSPAFSEYSPTLRSALSTTIFTLSAEAIPSIVAPREDVRMTEKPERVQEDVRRRLDEVFGDVLPDVTRDERDER